MTISHKTKLSALFVALTLAAAALLVPAAPASAGDGAFTLVGTAHLSEGIGNADPTKPGCLGGVAVGAHGTDLAAAAPAFAGFTYENGDTVAGTANGHLKIDNVEVGFDWQRIGVVALVDFTSGHTGNAVAAFAPVEAELFACNGKSNNNYAHGSWSNDEHAQVVGVGVIGH